MIFDALKYEINQVYPDLPVFFVSPDYTDQCPPYFVVNLVDGAPSGSGMSGRWQIRVAHTDKLLIESEIIPAIRSIFHDKSGLFGEPGSEEAFFLCGVILETPVLEGENSIFYKSIDLKIFYK